MQYGCLLVRHCSLASHSFASKIVRFTVRLTLTLLGSSGAARLLRLDETSGALRESDDSCSIPVGFGSAGSPRNGEGGVVVVSNGGKVTWSELGDGGLLVEASACEEDKERLGVDVEDVETVAAEVGGAPAGISRDGEGGEERRDEEKAEE